MKNRHAGKWPTTAARCAAWRSVKASRVLRSAFAGLIIAASMSAHAALKVLACEPEWAALASELGGELLEISSATSARQDPHRIQARPGLIARTRNADLLLCTGADLEAGWLPVLLQQSGNPRVQPGRPGHLLAADFVRLLEVPASVDRAHGDVHAAGNPHIQTDPRNIAAVARVLAERLAQLDPGNASTYAKRFADFDARWQSAMVSWTRRAAALRGVAVVSQHKGFAYLYDWLGLREVAVLEPKPGVEPSVAHLQQLVAALKSTPARFVVHAAYQDPRPSQWLASNTGIAIVELPYTVGGSDSASNLFKLFDDTLDRLLAAGAAR